MNRPGWIGNWFYGKDIKDRRPCEALRLFGTASQGQTLESGQEHADRCEWSPIPSARQASAYPVSVDFPPPVWWASVDLAPFEQPSASQQGE